MSTEAQSKQLQLPGLESEEEKEKVSTEPTVREHPILGKYVDVTVVPLLATEVKNTGFVSIGAYTADYHYNVKQSFPELVVQFLESVSVPERSYEESYSQKEGPSQRVVVEDVKVFNVIRH